jgi:hypothetical protein
VQLQPAAHQPTAPATTKPEIGSKRQWDGSKQHQSFIHALSRAFQEASGQAHNGYGQPQHPQQPAAGVIDQSANHRAPRDAYQHPGLDARGTNWHFQSNFIKCREQPCSALFCQICGFHGHTAATCSKKGKRLPGLNLHGYFQDSKPNSYPVRYEGPREHIGDGVERPAHNFSGPPRTNVATPTSPPASPHFISGSNNTARRSSGTHPERSARVNQANQTHEGGAAKPSTTPDSSQRDSQ